MAELPKENLWWARSFFIGPKSSGSALEARKGGATLQHKDKETGGVETNHIGRVTPGNSSCWKIDDVKSMSWRIILGYFLLIGGTENEEDVGSSSGSFAGSGTSASG
jgi:hypothetical protein